MGEISVSIIVPVYNAEKYLDKCISSILSQNLDNWELILVDDGSGDNSGMICDEFAAKNNRIKVIHKDNAGVSAARNTGMQHATGDYIGFVDADDWIKPDMYSRMLEYGRRNNADIVMCDAFTVYSNGKAEADTITALNGDNILTKENITSDLLLEIAGSVWRCIYRREMIQMNNIQFPVGIKFSEDRIFNLYAIGKADAVVYMKEGLYNRYVNLESAVHSFHTDYFGRFKAAAAAIDAAIENAWNNDKEIQTAYLGQLVNGALMAVCNYYYRTSTLTAKERREKLVTLCNDEILEDAIRKSGKTDCKTRWILEKKYTLLAIYAKLANLKHGR